MPQYQSLCRPCYTGRVHEAAWEICQNFFVEKIEAQDKAAYVLIGTPGCQKISAWSGYQGNVRGMYTCSRDSSMYVAIGATVYKCPDSESDPLISLGTISAMDIPVQMTDDGRYLAIVDGQEMWIYDMALGGSFTTPVTGQVRPNSITFLDSRAYCNNTFNDPSVQYPLTSSLIYYSNLGDLSQWAQQVEGQPYDPTNLVYIVAQGSADIGVSTLKRVGDKIWALGQRSYKVYATSTDPNQPLERVAGSLQDIGIYATNSAAVLRSTLFFMGTTIHGGICVYESSGYDVQRISTHAIEFQLANNDVTDAVGWTYELEGHQFYVLACRKAGMTFVWDDQEQAWHTASSEVAATGLQTLWDPIYATSRGTTTYVGSSLTGTISKLSLDYYTEADGRRITREISGIIVWDDLKLVRHTTLALDLHVGNGLTSATAQGYQPMVMMSYSDDNGQSWSAEEWETSGKIGEYLTRVRWNRLGMSYSRIYKFRFSDPVAWQIVGASINGASAPRQ